MKALTGIFLMTMAACGGGTGDGSGGDPDGGAVTDTTAPRVVSISPADGASGVRSDAEIVIEFDEPMDQLSVQNSLSTNQFGAVSYAWSEEGKVVTITPDLALEYAEGAGINPEGTEAISYTVELGLGATDEAGNAIEAPETSSFTTLKSITVTLVRDNDHTGAGTPDGVFTDADDFLQIGDDGQGLSSQARRGYITIDVSSIAEDYAEVVSASLVTEQLAVFNDPYAALGGGSGLLMEHVSFNLGSSNEDNAAFNSAAHSEVGVFAEAGDSALAIDVKAQVESDLAERVARLDRSQYRLRFADFTNLDDDPNFVLLSRDDLEIDIVYLTP